MIQGTLKLPGYTLPEMVDRSIALLRENEPPDGYYGCFSGGKDSVVIKELARMAGVRVTWHYNVTTIDPPELVRFIKKIHRDVVWDKPKHGNFFRRAAAVKGFPTRRARWCCDEYKEASPPRGSTLILGIRAEESAARAARWDFVTKHKRTGANCVQPILDWPSEELWQFIGATQIPYSELYDEGFTRLGCIGCPMAGRAGKLREFARWPGFERKWRAMFKAVWDRRAGTPQRDGREWFGTARFDDWEQMWRWWVSDNSVPAPRDGGLF